MGQSKFTLYKYIKLERSWRYCRAAFYSNGKIKPNRCTVGGKEKEHSEGACYLYHTKQWIAVGADPLETQRQRNVRLDEEEFKGLRGTAPMQKTPVEPISGKTPLTWQANDSAVSLSFNCRLERSNHNIGDLGKRLVANSKYLLM
jgi:hypothetical protein